MGLVGLLRVLWRRRIAVAVGALLAVAVAVAGIQRGAAPARTSSLSKVLIDTPKSLVADAQAQGAGTIHTRAQLMGRLIADDNAKAAIARKAGLRPDQLAILGSGTAAPPDVVTPLAEQALTVAKPIQPYLVAVEVEPSLSIVTIDANAPNREQAVRLDLAAVATLSSVARRAPGGGSSVAVERLGKPLIVTKAAGGGGMKAVGGALAFLGLWCLGCVLFDRALRRRGSERRPAAGSVDSINGLAT